MTRALLPIAFAWLACACADEPPVIDLPGMNEVSLETATEDGVSGSIASESFTAVDVRYRVVDRGGRAQLDLLFSDEPIERCGLPVERAGRLFWLRVPGVTSTAPATFATDDEAHTLGVHYEVPEDRDYATIGRGSGRVQLLRMESERLEGRVAVCFADDAGSCVRGTFEAHPCYSRIDGRMLRESPGLADEALAPAGHEARSP